MIKFTGRDKQGRYWYKGIRWLGPTNRLGQKGSKGFIMTHDGAVWGLVPNNGAE